MHTVFHLIEATTNNTTPGGSIRGNTVLYVRILIAKLSFGNVIPEILAPVKM